jgi:hypothetical protein
MRRPTKDLVDAVLPPTTSRRASADPAPPTAKKSSVKKECGDTDDEAWKTLPSGPETGDAGEPQSPLRDKLGRRDQLGLGKNGVGPPMLNSSAASDAISALIAGTSGRRKSVVADAGAEEKSDKSTKHSITVGAPSSASAGSKDQDLAVFDIDLPPLSQASSTSMSSSAHKSRTDASKPSRNGRRHSSISAMSSESRGKESGQTLSRTGSIGRKERGVGRDRERDKVKNAAEAGSDSGREGGALKESRASASARRKSMML